MKSKLIALIYLSSFSTAFAAEFLGDREDLGPYLYHPSQNVTTDWGISAHDVRQILSIQNRNQLFPLLGIRDGHMFQMALLGGQRFNTSIRGIRPHIVERLEQTGVGSKIERNQYPFAQRFAQDRAFAEANGDIRFFYVLEYFSADSKIETLGLGPLFEKNRDIAALFAELPAIWELQIEREKNLKEATEHYMRKITAGARLKARTLGAGASLEVIFVGNKAHEVRTKAWHTFHHFQTQTFHPSSIFAYALYENLMNQFVDINQFLLNEHESLPPNIRSLHESIASSLEEILNKLYPFAQKTYRALAKAELPTPAAEAYRAKNPNVSFDEASRVVAETLRQLAQQQAAAAPAKKSKSAKRNARRRAKAKEGAAAGAGATEESPDEDEGDDTVTPTTAAPGPGIASPIQSRDLFERKGPAMGAGPNAARPNYILADAELMARALQHPRFRGTKHADRFLASFSKHTGEYNNLFTSGEYLDSLKALSEVLQELGMATARLMFEEAQAHEHKAHKGKKSSGKLNSDYVDKLSSFAVLWGVVPPGWVSLRPAHDVHAKMFDFRKKDEQFRQQISARLARL